MVSIDKIDRNNEQVLNDEKFLSRLKSFLPSKQISSIYKVSNELNNNNNLDIHKSETQQTFVEDDKNNKESTSQANNLPNNYFEAIIDSNQNLGYLNNTIVQPRFELKPSNSSNSIVSEKIVLSNQNLIENNRTTKKCYPKAFCLSGRAIIVYLLLFICIFCLIAVIATILAIYLSSNESS